MMIPVKLLAILILAAHDVYGLFANCDGSCTLGQGDCDEDNDCVEGLVCFFDGWWGKDICKAGPYTKNYEWQDWEDWSECSVECGGEGTQMRMSYCTPPENGGWPCPDDWDSETQTCNNGPCPVNGGWGEWSEWEYCPVTCGGSSHSRTRECDSPAPQYGGDECPTLYGMKVDGSTNTETEACGIDPCPVHGGWGEFGPWDDCPVTCGGADQGRTRACDSPAPEYGGDDCTVDGSSNSETQRCNENPCPINGGWGAFGAWDDCPVSCGGADQGRTRVCDSPAPQYGGDDCTVDGSVDSETQRCNEYPCPIHGGWGEWSVWEDCPVTCGGAAHSRTRECDSPAPQYGGDDCPTMLGMVVDGSTNTETEACGIDPCPIDGGLSDWDDWGPCIGIGTLETTCGGGDQSRSRRCDNPAPQYGGEDCEGDLTECQRCNLDPCPSMCPAY